MPACTSAPECTRLSSAQDLGRGVGSERNGQSVRDVGTDGVADPSDVGFVRHDGRGARRGEIRLVGHQHPVEASAAATRRSGGVVRGRRGSAGTASRRSQNTSATRWSLEAKYVYAVAACDPGPTRDVADRQTVVAVQADLHDRGVDQAVDGVGLLVAQHLARWERGSPARAVDSGSGHLSRQ